MSNQKQNHHRKLAIKLPSWIWFPLCYKQEPFGQWTAEKQAVGEALKKSLKEHARIHDIKIDVEPNQHDYSGMYSTNND